MIERVGSLDHAKPGDLAYAEPRYLARVKDTRASCVLVPSGEFPDRTVILVNNPRAAFARATQWLIPAERPFTGIHPTAMLASSSRLGGDVAVGAWTMIEEEVQVGRSTVIFPGCYIGTRCKIGSDCTIFPNVVLYPGVEVDFLQRLLRFRVGKGVPLDTKDTIALGLGTNFSPLIIDFAMTVPFNGFNRNGIVK